MNVRVLVQEDKEFWLEFSHEITDGIIEGLISDDTVFWDGFDEYMESKIRKKEAYMITEGSEERCLGIVAFSRGNNRITYLGIEETIQYQKIGKRLLDIAMEQLDKTSPITANVLKTNDKVMEEELKLYKAYGFGVQEKEVIEAGVPAYKLIRPKEN